MSRLTPFARLLIVVGIVLGLYFGVKKFLPELSDKFKKPTDTETSAPTSSASDDIKSTPADNGSATPSQSGNNATAPANRPVFEYKPKE